MRGLAKIRYPYVINKNINAMRRCYIPNRRFALVLATERYNKPDPVNIGAGFEIKIKDLVGLIIKLTGFKGKVIGDTAKPDGQPRKMLDTTKAEKEFDFKATTRFAEGLRKVIDWYIKTRKKSERTR